MSYNFWNDFVDQWRINLIAPTAPVIGSWTNPNDISLLNVYGVVPNDLSIYYLPEPWWGNNGIDDLHSVVINNNPGTGNRSLQHYSVRNIPRLYGRINYNGFVANEVYQYIISGGAPFLLPTNNWHFVRRANVIHNALVACGAIVLPFPGRDFFRNHLSIEMIPWHTPDSNNPQYKNYVLANLKPIYDGVFCFAADRSRIINNDKLKKKVIIRSTYNKITPILNGLAAIGITTTRGFSINYPTGTNGHYFKFRFNDPLIKDIDFICIWGGTSRNDFPQPYDTVFNSIIASI
jgi:hypothetical protein